LARIVTRKRPVINLQATNHQKQKLRCCNTFEQSDICITILAVQNSYWQLFHISNNGYYINHQKLQVRIAIPLKGNHERAENNYNNVESSCVTRILIATRSPVLPLANLTACSFFPHGTRVFKTFRLDAVQLQRKIAFRTRIVFFIQTVGATNGDIIRAPCKFLNVGTKIG